MREILFRGKDVKEYWHIGLLAKRGNGWYISNSAGSPLAYEVIPSTVGQYTGLTDYNDKKIFEDDIVKYKNTDGIKLNGVALTIIGKVNYNEKTASFAIDGKDKIGAKHYDYFPIKNIEIIGNIHDNPELLKEV